MSGASQRRPGSYDRTSARWRCIRLDAADDRAVRGTNAVPSKRSHHPVVAEPLRSSQMEAGRHEGAPDRPRSRLGCPVREHRARSSRRLCHRVRGHPQSRRRARRAQFVRRGRPPKGSASRDAAREESSLEPMRPLREGLRTDWFELSPGPSLRSVERLRNRRPRRTANLTPAFACSVRDPDVVIVQGCPPPSCVHGHPRGQSQPCTFDTRAEHANEHLSELYWHGLGTGNPGAEAQLGPLKSEHRLSQSSPSGKNRLDPVL